MKIWKFEGIANYSNHFNWDNGMSTSLREETTLEEADIDESESYNISTYCKSIILPTRMESGVYVHFSQEYNGTRNVTGWVIAENGIHAIILLQEYDKTFSVIEYQEENN